MSDRAEQCAIPCLLLAPALRLAALHTYACSVGFCSLFPHPNKPNSFQTLSRTLPPHQTVIHLAGRTPLFSSLWINLIRETETVKQTHKCHQTQAVKSADLGQCVQTCTPVTQLHCPAGVTTLRRTRYLRLTLKGCMELLGENFFFPLLTYEKRVLGTKIQKHCLKKAELVCALHLGKNNTFLLPYRENTHKKPLQPLMFLHNRSRKLADDSLNPITIIRV